MRARLQLTPELELLVDKTIAHCRAKARKRLPRDAHAHAGILRFAEPSALSATATATAATAAATAAPSSSSQAGASFVPSADMEDAHRRDAVLAPYIMFYACRHLFVSLRRVLIAHMCLLRIAHAQADAGAVATEDGAQFAVPAFAAADSGEDASGDHRQQQQQQQQQHSSGGHVPGEKAGVGEEGRDSDDAKSFTSGLNEQMEDDALTFDEKPLHET